MTNAQHQPCISEIMPCHNSSTTVASSMQSVLQQTHSDFKLVTVNDGSIDNRLNIISGFNNSCFHLIMQQNAGVCVVRNTALEKATGEFIAFPDSDDSRVPAYLEKLHHAPEKDEEAKHVLKG